MRTSSKTSTAAICFLAAATLFAGCRQERSPRLVESKDSRKAAPRARTAKPAGKRAPAAERPTYSALNTVLILPVAFLSLVAGVLLQHWSYPVLFLIAASFIGAGALLTRCLPEKNHG